MGRHSTWTLAQLKRHEDIVIDAFIHRTRVQWIEHADELGHAVSTCQVKAAEVRNRLRAQRLAEQVRSAPKLLASPARPAAPAPARESEPSLPVSGASADHTRSTSTHRLQWDAEIRARIETQGVTAGLFGDPPRGRSALDQKGGKL